MEKKPLWTLDELYQDFLEWANKVVEEHKPSKVKEFFIENWDNDIGSYYMMSDTLFSDHLLLEVIREVGYTPHYNVRNYYDTWIMRIYEKIKN
jgi:hypothetical protein